jgi:FkbM family methyltransferase
MGFRYAASKFLHRLTGFSGYSSIDQPLDQTQSRLNKLASGFATEYSIIQRLEQIQLQLSLLERMSHGGRATYIGGNRILTKCVIAEAVIGFFVEANDILLSPWLILSGMYELDITNFFLQNLKPESRCVDVGANFGFFTCLMGRFCHRGKVVGIEPNHHVYELLRDNIYINGLHEWTSPKHAAISDSVGTLQLYRRIKRSGNTSISNVSEAFLAALGEPSSEPFQVACLRIDDLLSEFENRIDFIKIDVEGAEPLVMRGAKQVISANPQLKIVMEWSPNQIQAAGFDIAEFVDDLYSLGLRSLKIYPDGIEEITLEGLKDLAYCAGILLTSAK